MEKQPLNEAYTNEILEALQKMTETYDNISNLMKIRIPYVYWSVSCQIAGVSEDLMGCAKVEDPLHQRDPLINYPQGLLDLCQKRIDELEKIILESWWNVQANCSPDESFRAMLKVMLKWKDYLENICKNEETKNSIWDVLKARGIDPTKSFPVEMISRIEDIGRAQQLLKTILDEEIFDTLSKHNPYWESEYELESDKLHDLRSKFANFNDMLWDLWRILRKEEES